MLKLSLILGTIAALADVAGGLVLVRAKGVERYLRYFVALGAGFLMATAVLEMVPEGLKLNPDSALGPVLIMAGYCVVHLLEHTINAHFHFGEETHHGEFVSQHTGNSVLVGLSLHALFDGVAIGSGFLVSGGLGWLIFLAILLHKAPEGFTMASVMLASGRSRATALYSAIALAAATLAGVLVIELIPSWLPYGLPISAGVALYVGASDLVPEVNREPGIRMALVFFAGVGAFLLLRMMLPAL
ncbi:MAG: ZIP family metal transporter [Terracidiphilus sp.]|jgi:ZIP family zinc transporter/zinc and cadmium transporter